MDTNMYISVVVPVFNAENSLKELANRLHQTLEGLQKSYEIIFVDDYSRDGSWQKVKEIKSKTSEKVKGIRLTKNYGQHNATLCGIYHASGDFVVTIDDDLEFHPEDIPLLLKEQEQSNADVVYGVARKKQQTFLRKISNAIYKKLSRLNHEDHRPDGSSYRLIKKDLAKSILDHGRNFSFLDEFIIWHTSNIKSIDVSCSKNSKNRTRYSGWGLFILIRDLALVSSIGPLRLISFIGSLMVTVNFIYGLIIIYRKFILSITVPGYTSLIVAILFSSGLLMFGIGVVAEYLSKLIKLYYNQPVYKEKEII